MSEEGKSPRSTSEEASANASSRTVDDATMRDLVDKLKLLHYETEFCPLVKPPFRPLTHTYFSGPSTLDNPNMQFYYFTSLCTWLMGLCAVHLNAPGQFDDPNASATTILNELRSMGLSVSGIAPNRLKQGSGDAILTVLSMLVDNALSYRKFKLATIDYGKLDKYGESEDIVDQDEAGEEDAAGAEVEDHVQIDSDDEDEVYVRAAGARTGTGETAATTVGATAAPTSMINPEEWNLELERVAPLLQVRAPLDEDWRGRVENATIIMRAVEKMYPEVKQMLKRLDDDLEKARDRIQKREQTLAQQFSEQVEQYRVKLRELNTSRDAANLASQSVQQLTVELNQISDLLEQVKQDTEEHEAKISDTTPLMQIKAAVTKVLAEIKQMALRIGVLQNGVLHYVMQQTKEKREGPGVDEFIDDTFELYYD